MPPGELLEAWVVSEIRFAIGVCDIACTDVLPVSIYGSILSTRIAADLPTRMASTVFPMGLPESSFPLLLGNVFSQNFTAIAEIPGVTPDMLLAIDSSARNSWAYAFK